MYKNNNSCKFYSETSLPFVIKKCLPGSSIDFFLSKATASRRHWRSSDVLSGQMNTFLNCATFFSRFADSRSSVIGGMSRTGNTNSLTDRIYRFKPILTDSWWGSYPTLSSTTLITVPMSPLSFSFKPNTIILILRSSAWAPCWTAFCYFRMSGFCDPWVELTGSLFDFSRFISTFTADPCCSFLKVVCSFWRLITLSWEYKSEICNTIFSAEWCWPSKSVFEKSKITLAVHHLW